MELGRELGRELRREPGRVNNKDPTTTVGEVRELRMVGERREGRGEE